MSEEILEITNEPVADAPASLADKGLYPLDWKEQEIKLGKGRSVTVRRPTQDEIVKRDAELQKEIPVNRDGGFVLPDPTVNEETDAKYFDQIKTAGVDDLWESQKAKIFNELYAREIYVDEAFEIGDETIPVIEEIGKGDEPDFVITHLMRMPTEAEVKLFRKKSAGGEMKPGKRGRQNFVSSSNLRTAMSFYQQWFVGIDGATVDGKTCATEGLNVFVAHVDPLIQRQVVNAVVERLTGKLSD